MRRFALVGFSLVAVWAIVSLARWSAGALQHPAPNRVTIDAAQPAAELMGSLEARDHLLRTRQEHLQDALDDIEARDRVNLLIATEEGPPEPGQSADRRRDLRSELLQIEQERQLVQNEWAALAVTRRPRKR